MLLLRCVLCGRVSADKVFLLAGEKKALPRNLGVVVQMLVRCAVLSLAGGADAIKADNDNVSE